jgi:predicted nuclease of predicted toxin-antitoxin system
MHFLVDEQLPPLLCDVLAGKGFDAIHALALGTGQRIPDTVTIQKSVEEGYVVITKDADFLSSHILKGEPQKMVYVATGNIKNRNLLDLFRLVIPDLVRQLEQHNVIELTQAGMRMLH